MAESPPWVVVSTTGVKVDFADPEVRSEKPAAPADTAQIVEPFEEPADDRPGE